MVILDSCHTHKHVLDELNIYSELVSIGNYLVLPDTFIEFSPRDTFHKIGLGMLEIIHIRQRKLSRKE